MELAGFGLDPEFRAGDLLNEPRVAGRGVFAEIDFGRAPPFGRRTVPSGTGPVGFTPAETTSGRQSARQAELVQMNLPFFSTLRL